MPATAAITQTFAVAAAVAIPLNITARRRKSAPRARDWESLATGLLPLKRLVALALVVAVALVLLLLQQRVDLLGRVARRGLDLFSLIVGHTGTLPADRLYNRSLANRRGA